MVIISRTVYSQLKKSKSFYLEHKKDYIFEPKIQYIGSKNFLSSQSAKVAFPISNIEIDTTMFIVAMKNPLLKFLCDKEVET